ncbi:hypothetical protein M2375_000875 [Comamonas sp. BIGb0152]|uniref:hypothetical protein n=1 Tax=Comamonas sp. BIGb0152 TaxID=2940601 RepID=UPI002169807B|nr:hypothetical protein [Comamonas sp. BIGb0152]MCS4292669.1 hypothetical protein [Comamonas sp. BIGb0152]
MFIRSITTAAVLLAFLPAHAQTGPVTQAMPSGNPFFNTIGNPQNAAPIPHQQPFSSTRFEPVVNPGRHAFNPPLRLASTVMHASPSAPPGVIGSAFFRLSAQPYAVTDSGPFGADPSQNVFDELQRDAPPPSAPDFLFQEVEPYSHPAPTGVLPSAASQPPAFPVAVEAFKHHLARNSVWGISSYEEEPAWSCIAINGMACPPSMQQGIFGPNPFPA